MRSLLITYDYPPIISGIGTVFYNIFRLLSPEYSMVLAPSIEGSKEIDKKNRNVIVRYPVPFNSRPVRTVVLIVYTIKILLKENINVLICGTPLSIGFIGLLCKKIFSRPYIVFYYGGEYKKYKTQAFKFKLLNKILKEADYIIANSEFTKNEIKNYCLNEDKILKILPAVDTDKFRPDMDTAELKRKLNLNNKKVLLTVSRLVKRKGIDTVISVLPDIIKDCENIVYLVVGKGEEESNLRDLAERKGIKDNVIFCGMVSDEEISKYYGICDIYIMLNKETEGNETFEGFGTSFIEASSCGKPVIGGISGGVKDAVINGETGFLVDPEDTHEIKRIIFKLLKEEQYAREFGSSGRKRVENDFRWKDRADELGKILKKFL